MTQLETTAILSHGRLLADILEKTGGLVTDGPASCVVHRIEFEAGSSTGCYACTLSQSMRRHATDRLCDLMKQGIWKGRGTR